VPVRATTRSSLVDAARPTVPGRRGRPRRLRGCSAGSVLVVAAVLAAYVGGPGPAAGHAPGSAAGPVSLRTAPASQVTVLPTGSSSNGGCQFNNNTINSGPGFDRGELPFRSGRGFHRGDVPFLGLIITDLMRRCLDQLNHQGGGSGRRRSND